MISGKETAMARFMQDFQVIAGPCAAAVQKRDAVNAARKKIKQPG